MLVRPTKAELSEFGEPDMVIYNAGGFPANIYTATMESKTSGQNFAKYEEGVRSQIPPTNTIV